MKKYTILSAILVSGLLVNNYTYATTNNVVNTSTTVKKVIKKPIIKKPIKVLPKTPVVPTYSLNKPFVLGDIEYTILSVQTFDKIGVQNTFSDYKYAKNGTYLMIRYTYKNLSKSDEDKTSGELNIISGDNMYTSSSEGTVYGEYQMNWNQSSDGVNVASYIPSGIKKEVFESFDVPKDILEKGILYIDGSSFAGKKLTLKINLSNFK